MRTMGNSWRCSWINRNFTAGVAQRCSPLFLRYPFLAAIFHFHALIASFPLLLLFDVPSLERLLALALQILCTIYGNVLSEIPRSAAICVLLFPLVLKSVTACCLNSLV